MFREDNIGAGRDAGVWWLLIGNERDRVVIFGVEAAEKIQYLAWLGEGRWQAALGGRCTGRSSCRPDRGCRTQPRGRRCGGVGCHGRGRPMV